MEAKNIERAGKDLDRLVKIKSICDYSMQPLDASFVSDTPTDSWKQGITTQEEPFNVGSVLVLFCTHLLPGVLGEKILNIWTFSVRHSRTLCRKQLVAFWIPEEWNTSSLGCVSSKCLM